MRRFEIDVKKLDEAQLQSFDIDFVTDDLYAFITQCIDRDFPNGEFSFVDVGGGMGLFTDRLLEQYPRAMGTVVDNSDLLLYRNVPNPRKKTVFASATEMKYQFEPQSFDLVFFNLSLHHFITDTYAGTRAIQAEALRQGRMLLQPHGRVCIVENNYDGVVIHNFPGKVIFHLTSSKRFAPLVKKLGANTAGCGVCFHSTKAWLATSENAGLQCLQKCEDFPVWDLSFKARLRNILLTIRNRPRTAFWLAS